MPPHSQRSASRSFARILACFVIIMMDDDDDDDDADDDSDDIDDDDGDSGYLSASRVA